jgi:hypothetical protein
VEMLSAYSNPADQVRRFRATLAELLSARAPADEPDLGATSTPAQDDVRDRAALDVVRAMASPWCRQR